jgi:uncharacterized glyoxalase superfamily protein PhnB
VLPAGRRPVEAAKAAGAEIVREPTREEYGSFCGARDLEGNEWLAQLELRSAAIAFQNV